MVKNAKKIEKNASLNIDSSDIKVSKKTKNKAKKLAQNTSGKVWACAFLCLVIGVMVGVGAFYFIARNDCFEIIGEDELTFTIDEKFTDPGVKIISIGQDYSKDAKIETNLKIDANGNYYSDEVGTFYIKYSSVDFKYGTLFKIQKIRLITFVEPSEGENINE